MKKYRIITAITAVCLALCAAVWSQTKTVEETPVLLQVAAVSTPEPTIGDAATETGITLPAKKEKVEILQDEPLHEVIPKLEPAPEEVPAIPEAQSIPEPESVSAPAPTSAPVPPQAVVDPQPDDMVYVPGFGWLECQGPSEVIHDENIYENGNKIGIMG